MKTRFKPKSKVTAAATATTLEPAKLPPSESNPPKVVVLPRGASNDARIISLPNPASSIPNRYFYCPSLGLHEFTKIAAPKSAPRSWLLSAAEDSAGKEDEDDDGTPERLTEGYLIKEPDMLLATPFDPLFLILSAFLPKSKSQGTKQMFLAFDDYLDALTEAWPQYKHILSMPRFRERLERRTAAVCDEVDAGDEKMYRISEEKLALEILSKAQRMSDNGLPASMEEQFVKDALKVPVLNPLEALTENPAPVMSTEDSQTSTDSQGAISTAADSQTSDSTAPTSVSSTPPSKADAQAAEKEQSGVVNQLMRLRTALDFILGSYIPDHIRAIINKASTANSLVDFSPLENHLAHIATVRRQAHALRSVSDNISRKRAIEDEEAAEARAEKKQKKEEEEKKKKAESRAMKDLRKVNTSGMKKLSAFFAKKPAL
jgi:hypothetical protein